MKSAGLRLGIVLFTVIAISLAGGRLSADAPPAIEGQINPVRSGCHRSAYSQTCVFPGNGKHRSRSTATCGTHEYQDFEPAKTFLTLNKPAVPATRPTASVKIDNFAFTPRELTVAAGTTVTWQNADDVPHTATARDDPRTFDSGTLDTDDKFAFTFEKPGKYAYFCKVHPHMTGVVIVK